MPFDFVATPLAGETAKEVEENILFAKQVCHALLANGITPYAPHLFFTQFLRDEIATERTLGISGGLDMMAEARRVWFVLPPWRTTLSKGMQAEWNEAKKLGKLHALFTSLEDVLAVLRTPNATPFIFDQYAKAEKAQAEGKPF